MEPPSQGLAKMWHSFGFSAFLRQAHESRKNLEFNTKGKPPPVWIGGG